MTERQNFDDELQFIIRLTVSAIKKDVNKILKKSRDTQTPLTAVEVNSLSKHLASITNVKRERRASSIDTDLSKVDDNELDSILGNEDEPE